MRKQIGLKNNRKWSGFVFERSKKGTPKSFISELVRKQSSSSRRREGFTLIELLLYLGLVAIFMTAVVYFTWDVVLGNVKARVHQEVQENLRFAAHKAQLAVRNADSIDTGESDFGVNLATNPGTTLSLLGTGSYYPVRFRVEGGVLQIRHGEGSWISLTSSLIEVTNIAFTNLSDAVSENIRLTLTIRHRNPSGKTEWDKEATFETSAQLR